MALQQADFPALAQHLAGIANEVQSISNATPTIANVANQLDQIQQLLVQMQQQLGRIEGKLTELNVLSPIRLHNVVASLTAPLVFPPLPQGVNPPENHPNTKHDLMHMDVQTGQAMAIAFNLPALPIDAPVQLIRQQVMNHLGALVAV